MVNEKGGCKVGKKKKKLVPVREAPAVPKKRKFIIKNAEARKKEKKARIIKKVRELGKSMVAKKQAKAKATETLAKKLKIHPRYRDAALVRAEKRKAPKAAKPKAIKNKDLYLFSMNKRPFNYRKNMREDEPEKYKMIMKYSKENPEVYKKRTTELQKEVESNLGGMKTFGEVLNEPAKPYPSTLVEDYHFWHEDAEAIHKETGKIPKKNPYNNDGDDDLVWYDPNDEDAGMRFKKSKKFDKPYYVRLANGSIEYNGKGNKHKFHYYQ